MNTDLQGLLDKIKEYTPWANLPFIEKAYDYAVCAHEGQNRASGEPFVTHPIEVAYILADMSLDVESIAAALLHDIVEDTSKTTHDIKELFGNEIAILVAGVTKLDKIPYSTKEEQQVENLRKMFLAMAKDIRVILIKLADRLHNMRTLRSMPEHKQRETARETLEVYAPIAHRLGMSKIKWELEDLSLRYIDPIGYYEIVDKISQKRQEREEFINNIIQIMQKRLDEMEVKAHLEGRAKHFYSIYRKMFTQNKTIEEIHDLYAVRAIVDTVADCYSVLGMVHELYKPMPGRFKDYIAMPKPNMYQSLHTTVMGINGTPFEVQIRTWDMHNTAENGIAAHWKYKENKIEGDDFDSKLAWIKQLIEIQQEITNAADFMHSLKIDIFNDEVFIFTPKGEVIGLPSNSTIVDLAYAIHSAVGNRMIGAKANGKIVTLDYKLQNGDIVEILTSSAIHGPSRDWLKIANTSQARNNINQWFKKENRDENKTKGKELLEKDLKKSGIPLSTLSDLKNIDFYLKKYSFKTMEDFYAALGYGNTNANRMFARLKEECRKNLPKNIAPTARSLITKISRRPNTTGIIVNGIDNCLVRFSHCCNPIPGDDIVGYITRGRGVAVHRRDCMNIVNSEFDEEQMERFIPVMWTENTADNYQSLLSVTAGDRKGLLVDVTAALKDLHIDIVGFNARMVPKGKLAIIDITLEITGTPQLEAAINNLKKVEGVISVVRRHQ